MGGFSFLTTVKMIVPSIVLHGSIWNALHPAMHGLEDVPAREGPPSWLFGKFVSTPYFKFLYKNHQGHHVVGGQGNYNVCCPGTDHVLQTFIKEEDWRPRQALSLEKLAKRAETEAPPDLVVSA